MKRVIFVVATMLLGGMAMAQTEKGSKVINGNIRIGGNDRNYKSEYVSGNEYSDKSFNKEFDFGAGIGFFIRDNFSVGFGLGNDYTRIKSYWNNDKNDFDYKREWNTASGLIFCKKYLPVANKLYFTIGGNISSGILKGESSYAVGNDEKYNDSGLNVGASANIGFTYFATKHLGLSTSLGSLNYSFSKTKSTSESDSVYRQQVLRSSYLYSNTFFSSLGMELNYFF